MKKFLASLILGLAAFVTLYPICSFWYVTLFGTGFPKSPDLVNFVGFLETGALVMFIGIVVLASIWMIVEWALEELGIYL